MGSGTAPTSPSRTNQQVRAAGARAGATASTPPSRPGRSRRCDEPAARATERPQRIAGEVRTRQRLSQRWTQSSMATARASRRPPPLPCRGTLVDGGARRLGEPERQVDQRHLLLLQPDVRGEGELVHRTQHPAVVRLAEFPVGHGEALLLDERLLVVQGLAWSTLIEFSLQPTWFDHGQRTTKGATSSIRPDDGLSLRDASARRTWHRPD